MPQDLFEVEPTQERPDSGAAGPFTLPHYVKPPNDYRLTMIQALDVGGWEGMFWAAATEWLEANDEVRQSYKALADLEHTLDQFKETFRTAIIEGAFDSWDALLRDGLARGGSQQSRDAKAEGLYRADEAVGEILGTVELQRRSYDEARYRLSVAEQKRKDSGRMLSSRENSERSIMDLGPIPFRVVPDHLKDDLFDPGVEEAVARDEPPAIAPIPIQL